MQSERKKWDARYQDSQDERPEPDPYLIEAYTKFVSPLFPRQGRALDVAGGMGRHAIWLARQGWYTTLLDISPVALDAARKWSSGEHLRLEFVEADLDDYLLPEDAFDLITVFNFLQRSLFLSLQQCLCPGGVIIYKTRMPVHNGCGCAGHTGLPTSSRRVAAYLFRVWNRGLPYREQPARPHRRTGCPQTSVMTSLIYC